MPQPLHHGQPAVRRTWHLTAALVLASAGVLGTVTPAPAQAAPAQTGPAQAAPVRTETIASAQARVDRLQDVAKRATETLAKGTEQWEADRKRLRRVAMMLTTTKRQVTRAERLAGANGAQLKGLARHLYMNPLPSQLQLAVSVGPTEFTGAMQALGSLDVASASGGVLIRKAQAARVVLLSEQRTATQLTEEARQLERRSAANLAELQALAKRTADELRSAQEALQRARGMAASRASAARAARSRITSFSGGTCTGRPIGNQSNGNLDPASLCPLWMGNGATLKASAAAAFNRMSKYHASVKGRPLCVTGGYRSYQRQVELYRTKPGLAAVPGRSEHGWGNAVDLCGGVETTGSAAHQWMKANAGNFGWFHPSWAQPSGSRPEPWHWEFSG